MATVSVNIISHNSARYLSDCLRSVEEQVGVTCKVVVVDNASDDHTLSLLREHHPTVTVLRNVKNLGFCKAHNQAIQFWPSDYVLFLNPDVVLSQGYIKKLVDWLGEHSQAGIVSGKLLQLDRQQVVDVLAPDRLDSTGITASRLRQFTDRGQGQEDRGQYDHVEEVFAVSLSAALVRRTALEDVKLPLSDGRAAKTFGESAEYYEYLDEDFFMYKDDIDLGWRLRWRGWQAWYLPTVEARHVRGSGIETVNGWRSTIRRRQRRSSLINRYSYKNQFLTLIKNESLGSWLRVGPLIVGWELIKMIYCLIAEPSTLSILPTFIRQLPSALRKRRLISRRRSVASREITHWFKRPA